MKRVELSDKDWQRVHAIARDLALDVDRNELGKAMSYFRLHRKKEDFLTLLERLSRSQEYVRSQQTRTYFERILRTCRQYLAGVDDAHALVMVSWAFRLVTYYQNKTEVSSVC